MAHRTHEFACTVRWTGSERGSTRSYETYSREHRIEIAGKPTLVGSGASTFGGDDSLHNPEDLLVAALSACHMLSYLALAAREGVLVEAYEDASTGTMEPVNKVIRFTRVLLRPKVTVAKGTDMALARALHERAHATCFIANSVNFPVENEPTIVERG